MKTNKIAMIAFLIIASSSMLLSTAARSQTYKADFTTKSVFAGAGTDITHTATIVAPSLTSIGSYKLTLPNTLPTNGYILETDGSGNLGWVNPSTGLAVTLAGDVTGPSGTNTVTKINGVSLGASTSSPTDANMLIYNGTTNGGISWNAVAMGADVKIDNTGAATIQANGTAGNDIGAALGDATNNLSLGVNITTSETLSSGGDATLGTSSGAIANSFGTGGNASNVLNTIGSTGGGSVTTINGGVNFSGAVTYTSAPTIPLHDDYFFIGNSSGDAAAEQITQDVSITDGGVATVNGSNAATFAAQHAISAVGNISTTAGTVSGATGTFTNLSGTTMTGNLAMGSNNITGAGTIAGTGITGTSVTAGSGTISTTGAVDGGTGVFTAALSADGITTTGGLTSGGGATALNTADADGVNIANGAFANAVNIGYGTAPLGATYSTTTIGGAVDFTGTVTMPSGSVTASSLALADNKILIGGSDGFAHAQTLGTDISTTDAGAVTVKSATGATGFSITNLAQTNGALNNTGSLHTTGGDVNINALAASGNINIGDTSNAGNINIGNTASTNTIAGTTGITGATTIAGTTNINQTGSSVTTIGNSGSTNVIAGGTTIGAVTLSSPTALDASSGTLTVNAINSLYLITTAGTVSAIAGAAPTTGRIVELLNKSLGVVTLTYNVTSPGNFELNGSDVLLGPNGSISLIYDGTNWTVVE
jgi:hypothetical protein